MLTHARYAYHDFYTRIIEFLLAAQFAAASPADGPLDEAASPKVAASKPKPLR